MFQSHQPASAARTSSIGTSGRRLVVELRLAPMHCQRYPHDCVCARCWTIASWRMSTGIMRALDARCTRLGSAAPATETRKFRALRGRPFHMAIREAALPLSNRSRPAFCGRCESRPPSLPRHNFGIPQLLTVPEDIPPRPPSSHGTRVQGNYYSVAARALFIWDYLATLDREIEYVWGQRLSAASGLFVVNRYVNLLITLLELVEQAPFQTPKVFLVRPTALASTERQRRAFATLRVYAVWSRDWRPALPVLVLALMTPVSNLVASVQSIREVLHCSQVDSIWISLALRFLHQDPPSDALFRQTLRLTCTAIVIAERATTTAYDALVLILTFIKTSQARRAAMSLSRRPSLVALILRDGALLVIMNIAQIVVAAEFPGNNFVAFFISPLTSILISRFLLNLREVAQEPEQTYQDTMDTAIISTRFPSIHIPSSALGNMGASLKSGFDAETAEGMYEEKISAASEPFLAGLLGEVRRTDIELSHIT
ncbi:hypothetical protein NUW54_g1796 [Trametes sanguinea]|uniref:Uncharacterized protein n=1 Tax=Trametes sanguinea TaxID=158606 RepID=A0ACC1Q948_9APHY|nr:hypothetical protein NUW54_g1796 [Trametes sanguinea]